MTASGVGFAEHDLVPDDEAVYLLFPFEFGQFPADGEFVELQLLGKFVKADGAGTLYTLADDFTAGLELGHVGSRRRWFKCASQNLAHGPTYPAVSGSLSRYFVAVRAGREVPGAGSLARMPGPGTAQVSGRVDERMRPQGGRGGARGERGARASRGQRERERGRGEQARTARAGGAGRGWGGRRRNGAARDAWERLDDEAE